MANTDKLIGNLEQEELVDLEKIKLVDNGDAVTDLKLDRSNEKEKINILPGADYVPVRKVNTPPMERPVIVAVDQNNLVLGNGNNFNWVKWFTRFVLVIAWDILVFYAFYIFFMKSEK